MLRASGNGKFNTGDACQEVRQHKQERRRSATAAGSIATGENRGVGVQL